MPKRVRKAESLGVTRANAHRHIGSSALNDIVEESGRALNDLQFVIQHTDFTGKLTADPQGLAIAEQFCRDTDAWNQRKDSFPDDTVHRLIALFLGHVFKQTQLGNWVVYGGKHHVFHPVVIQLESDPDKYVQPFLYCHDLRTNMNLRGARSGKSLTMLFNDPAKSATP